MVKSSKITGNSTVCSTIFGLTSKKAPILSPTGPFLWGESTGSRWIPPSKGRQCGKCFHVMPSPYFSPSETMGFLLCAYYIKLFFFLWMTEAFFSIFFMVIVYYCFRILNIWVKYSVNTTFKSGWRFEEWMFLLTEATKTRVECIHELLIHIKVWP